MYVLMMILIPTRILISIDKLQFLDLELGVFVFGWTCELIWLNLIFSPMSLCRPGSSPPFCLPSSVWHCHCRSFQSNPLQWTQNCSMWKEFTVVWCKNSKIMPTVLQKCPSHHRLELFYSVLCRTLLSVALGTFASYYCDSFAIFFLFFKCLPCVPLLSPFLSDSPKSASPAGLHGASSRGVWQVQRGPKWQVQWEVQRGAGGQVQWQVCPQVL